MCPGEVDADVGDRNYLVLAKPNVIMNDIRLRGLGVLELTLPVEGVLTATPRPLGTLSAPCGVPPLVRG
jgi:hypothetical protein